jgi:hypothetical protein
MILNREKGGYYLGQAIRIGGSFRVDSTNNPDAVRDGNSNCIASVVLTSTGLFTVTFEGDWPLPEKLITWHVDMQRVAEPTQAGHAYLLLDSYDPAARTFQIAFSGPEASDPDDTHLVTADPDDNDWICFELVGCIDSSGTDAV